MRSSSRYLMRAPNAAALAAWKELNDRQQGTLAAIYGLDQEKVQTRKRDGAAGKWDSTPASVWRRVDFAHEPSDRRLFGWTQLQSRLEDGGWDNQGNGSTMAALASRALIKRDCRPTAFGWMHTVALTREGRAAARAGTSLAPGGTPKAALSERSWEVLALLWKQGLRAEILRWGYSKTIEFVLIDKHVPPLAEPVSGGYRITDRGRDFYREHYAAHVAAWPHVSAAHPDGAAAEPWPPQADQILASHRLFYLELCEAWQDAHTALQAARAEEDAAAPAAVAGLPAAVNAQIADRHRLWQETARRRAELAASHTEDLCQRAERAAREFAAVALAAFAAAVAGTDPLVHLRPPSSDVDTWDEPPLPQPPQTGIPAIDDEAAKRHAAAVGAPQRRRGPAPARRRQRSLTPERPPLPGAALAALADFLRGHVHKGTLRRRLHGAD